MEQLHELPAPSDPSGTPGVLVTELGVRVGQKTAARWGADLLAGADPHDYAEMIDYLGSNCRTAAFDPAGTTTGHERGARAGCCTSGPTPSLPWW